MYIYVSVYVYLPLSSTHAQLPPPPQIIKHPHSPQNRAHLPPNTHTHTQICIHAHTYPLTPFITHPRTKNNSPQNRAQLPSSLPEGKRRELFAWSVVDLLSVGLQNNELQLVRK